MTTSHLCQVDCTGAQRCLRATGSTSCLFWPFNFQVKNEWIYVIYVSLDSMGHRLSEDIAISSTHD